MSDKELPTFDLVEEKDEPIRRLQEQRAGTETIDLSLLLTKDVTSSGSFGVGGAIRQTTFGKLTESLPIPALLIDESYNIVVVNQACGRIGSGSIQHRRGKRNLLSLMFTPVPFWSKTEGGR